MKYIKLLRVHHYIKNLLIFAALIFSGQFFNLELLKTAGFGFLAFSFMASVIYIINDIKDADKDKKHPKKCKRPIASGAVSKTQAGVIAVILFGLSMLFNYLCFSLEATAVLLGYLLLNIAYSAKLKHIPIIDVVVLATGFVLRVVYGSLITNIPLSQWMFLTIFAGSLFLGFGKRLGEKSKGTRSVLEKYPVKFLEDSLNMSLVLALVFYSLWTLEKNLIWTIPIVLVIVLKYKLNLDNGSDGDPVEVLLHDYVLIGLGLLYVTLMFFALYVR